MSLTTAVEELRLIDHHVHTVLPGPLSRAQFEALITESDQPAPAGTTQFDSQLGFAVRRWCAPVLGLEAGAAPDAYLRHRDSLTGTGAAARLLAATGCSRLLVDTGFIEPGSVSLADLASMSGAAVGEVVRLESVAEELVMSGCEAADFADRYQEALWHRSADAVGVKSIVAYRYGLDFDPARPGRQELTAAAGQWLSAVQASGRTRVTDPVLLRELLWAAVDRGLPIQIHTGFGDLDLDLRRANPLLARQFLGSIAGRGVPVVLLHCYPYHREAGSLAQIYPHVYLDIGMTMNYVGARCAAVLAETLELAPFSKILYSSDAYGLPELVYLGARSWRNAIIEVLGGWVGTGEWTEADAIRVAGLIGAGNAARLYELPGLG